MFNDLLIAWYAQIPVVIGGVLHMMAVKKNCLPRLSMPVHTAMLGQNKTWRGVVLMPLFTVFGALCLWPAEIALGSRAVFGPHLLTAGLVAGLGYILAELPNSLLKRRLGIAPGATPEKARWLFIMLDQLDSGIGVAIAYYLYPGLPLQVCLLFALSFPVTALVVKRLLFISQLKASPV